MGRVVSSEHWEGPQHQSVIPANVTGDVNKRSKVTLRCSYHFLNLGKGFALNVIFDY